jgi:hypothetical protein
VRHGGEIGADAEHGVLQRRLALAAPLQTGFKSRDLLLGLLQVHFQS